MLWRHPLPWLLALLSVSPVSYAHPELARLAKLEGTWRCEVGKAQLTVTLAARHARPDQEKSPVESFTVDLAGAPVARLGLKTGLLTYDPRDGRFHFDAEGRCGQPAPLEDDDDPESGMQRCDRVSAISTESAGAEGSWTVRRQGGPHAGASQTLRVRTLGKGRLGLRLMAGSRRVFAASCTRTKR